MQPDSFDIGYLSPHAPSAYVSSEEGDEVTDLVGKGLALAAKTSSLPSGFFSSKTQSSESPFRQQQSH